VEQSFEGRNALEESLDELYEALRQIRLSLESEHQSAAPTVQDMISVALKRFINDWENADTQSQLLSELLEHRRVARSNMGKRHSDGGEERAE
jgi:hypothetical protein